MKKKFIKIGIFIIIIVISILSGVGIDLVVRPSDDGVLINTSFSLHLSPQHIPALIEEDGEIIEDENIVTVEEVESNLEVDCSDEECGLGKYIYAPTATWQEFKDFTYAKCWNTDDLYGSQCWDMADLFWQNYAGRNFSTCGTHAAKGSWNCKDYNAGNEFELITEPTNLKSGDWVIFSSGKYGHVGMAVGNYNNGYIALLGQNQGGASCEGGGAAANIINISLKSFIGAFRPKTYITPEPQPEPEPEPTPLPISNCVEWHVLKGDTMSKIMLECENTVVYGEPMNEYARSWYSMIFKPGQSVYDGWMSETGVGLYAGDDIEHRIK